MPLLIPVLLALFPRTRLMLPRSRCLQYGETDLLTDA